MHANSPLGRADRQSPINALARRFSLPILGGYSHATTCAFNRNPRLKSRVNVAPAIVEAGGLGDGWAGAWRDRPTMPRLPARRPSNEQASTLLKRGAAIRQKWSARRALIMRGAVPGVIEGKQSSGVTEGIRAMTPCA